MAKQYVEQREDVYWVAGMRVSLDSIVYAFLEEQTAESIAPAIPALSHRSYTTYAGGLSRSLFRLPEVVFDTPCKARSEVRRNPLQRWVAMWIELRHA